MKPMRFTCENIYIYLFHYLKCAFSDNMRTTIKYKRRNSKIAMNDIHALIFFFTRTIVEDKI